MARYTGPKCRLCRREGVKLFLKGTRCDSEKCAMVKHSQTPGQHGTSRRRPSDYSLHLREKQKVKRIYGVLEKQLRRYLRMAQKEKGVTGAALLEILERRLDNVVYRLGLAASRSSARQIVSQGHVSVDGKKVDRPSYSVREGEVIGVAKPVVMEAGAREVPGWLVRDKKKAEGKVVRLPKRDEVDPTIKEHLIIEFYSKG